MANERSARSDLTGVISGVGLARTLPPVLPPNFLSRKSILSDLAVDLGGFTLISAPAGFGKSSLVAEFVSSLELPVIWYTSTDQDSPRDINAHFLQAIRNVEPDFADHLIDRVSEPVQDFYPQVFSELVQIKKHFILVVDNNRTSNPENEKVLNRFLELLPPNVHYILINRRNPNPDRYALSSIINFKMYSLNDLRFSDAEVNKLCQIHGIDLNNLEAIELIRTAKGWPSAVNMLATNISRGIKTDKFTYDGTFSDEPVNFLVSQLLSSLSIDDRGILESLALVESFSAELAEFILGTKYSLAKINSFATEGLFLVKSLGSEGNFSVNPLIKNSILTLTKFDQKELQALHSRIGQYFQKKGDYISALSHVKESGDSEKYRSLFRNSMRQLIATGRAKELLTMAHIVGDNSVIGKLKRQTVELIGLTADFQYENALSLIEEMIFAAKGSELEQFIYKFISAVKIYIDFATGRTEDLEKSYQAVRQESGRQLDLGVADKISILRTMAAKELIYDNAPALEALMIEAREIAESDKSPLVLYLLQGIEAAVLISQGEFKDALVVANNVISQADRNGYSGIFGPLDAMYVRARCFLEFAQTETALTEFEKIRNLAATWRQYSWQYLAESFLARDLALNGESAAALEIVRTERDRIAGLNFLNGLGTFADLTELFIRYTMKDWDRVGVLLGRVPEFLLVKRIRPIHQSMTGKKIERFSYVDLPEINAKDQIYKYLAETEEKIESEALAVLAMRKALDVGARVGAKETFLRQGADVLNVIIKIAGEQPTVYLEELTSAITSRLKQRSANAIGLRASLTKRELEILHHLATGNAISSIGATLHVSQNTMKTHLKNIYKKLDAQGRDDAVLKAKNLYIL